MLYSIGYATKEINEFIDLLKDNNINCLVDVRTVPFSKQFPKYNINYLKKVLNENNIYYLSFKDEFGARRFENAAYQDLKLYDNISITYVNFEQVWKLPIFQKGVERIMNGLNKGYNICFMCSEKDPFNCHRTFMVSQYFYNKGLSIKHIVDKNLSYSHEQIISRLEEFFQKKQKKYLRFKKSLLKESTLFTYNNEVINDDSYWENFFAEYSIDKGLLLKNIDVGYKKGFDEVD